MSSANIAARPSLSRSRRVVWELRSQAPQSQGCGMVAAGIAVAICRIGPFDDRPIFAFFGSVNCSTVRGPEHGRDDGVLDGAGPCAVQRGGLWVCHD